MKDTDVQILCGCDVDTICPQGKLPPYRRQCAVVVPEDDLFRIVMQLPEFKRRYTMTENENLRLRALEQAVIYCLNNPLKKVEEKAKKFEKFLKGEDDGQR
jgi:hypothetical protein